MLNIKTNIYFEDNAVKNHKEEFANFGKNALIVTGHSSEKNGSLDDVLFSLKDNNISYCIYNEVEENPSVETVVKATNFAKKEKCDFVVAIGGGSIIDCAKAVVMLLRAFDDNVDFEEGLKYLYNKDVNRALQVFTPTNRQYSLVAIPTTCGSGAEVTGNAVLTLHKDKTKNSAVHLVFPKIAFVDGRYLLNAPKKLLQTTSLDALSHLVESYVNKRANIYTRQLAINGFELWQKTKKYLNNEVEINKEICDNLIMSSTFAGICISHTSTSIPHRLSYRATYGNHISHGLAVAYFLANFLDLCKGEYKNRILELTAFQNINEFKLFINNIIGNLGIDKEYILQAIDDVLHNEKVLNSVDFEVNKDVLMRICNI